MVVTLLFLETYSRWTNFVEDQIQRWKVHFDWLLKCPSDRDIILVRYEDLKNDLVDEMGKILTFLHFPYTRKLRSSSVHQFYPIFIYGWPHPHAGFLGERKESLVTTACACTNPYQQNMVSEIHPCILRILQLFGTCSGYQAHFSLPQESLGMRLHLWFTFGYL